MAGGLPQTQQGLEHVHLALGEPLLVDFAQQGGTVAVAEIDVNAALLLPHVAVDRLLEFFGQLGGDFLFRAAENERAQAVREDVGGPVVLCVRRRSA